MGFKSIEDDSVLEKYNKLWRLGVYPGYAMPCESINYCMKPGKTTYVYAPPHAGKSYWWFWVMLCMAQEHNLVFAVFSNEMEEAHAMLGLLTEMLVGNKFIDDTFGVSKEDKIKAQKFLMKHFVVIEKIKTVQEFFSEIDQINESRIAKGLQAVDCGVIDPWNSLSHPLNGQPRDRQLEDLLTYVNEETKDRKMHVTIITHSRDKETILQKSSGVYFQPPVKPNEIAQGQGWFRKGQMMISLWRPAEGMHMPSSTNEYEEGYLLIDMQKVKPKESGKFGKTTIYYDWKRITYYEMIDGQRHYPLKQIAYDEKGTNTGESQISPNHDFENGKDDTPF